MLRVKERKSVDCDVDVDENNEKTIKSVRVQGREEERGRKSEWKRETRGKRRERKREPSVRCILFLFPPFLHENKQDRH